jgi:hypothetical protein
MAAGPGIRDEHPGVRALHRARCGYAWPDADPVARCRIRTAWGPHWWTSKLGLLAGAVWILGAAQPPACPAPRSCSLIAAPLWIDMLGFCLGRRGPSRWSGLFFPAAVTLLNFSSTHRIGPALTGSISSTSPLFSLLAALAAAGRGDPRARDDGHPLA